MSESESELLLLLGANWFILFPDLYYSYSERSSTTGSFQTDSDLLSVFIFRSSERKLPQHWKVCLSFVDSCWKRLFWGFVNGGYGLCVFVYVVVGVCLISQVPPQVPPQVPHRFPIYSSQVPHWFPTRSSIGSSQVPLRFLRAVQYYL